MKHSLWSRDNSSRSGYATWSRVTACVVLAVAAGAAAMPISASARTELTIGIGTQDTTTNTVAGGTVIKNLKLLEKYLPHTGKYADIDYNIDWENFTSGPPVTNAMMADKLQIGMMGDYPLLVNGATGQKLDGDATELIAILAYNAQGAGNGIVVNKDSPYYKLSDLKGKTISTPFGSAAYGMLQAVMKKNGWGPDYWNMTNQSPEVGSSAIQQNKIDAHADFVPFAELLPYRGYARKIFDGAQTGVPTFHAVVVRKDFANKYPEIVEAYLNALLDANAWIKADPQRAAEKVQEWTHIDKEVAYIFLSPNGIDTLDPTFKPILLNSLDGDLANLKALGSVTNFDKKAWLNDSYLQDVFKKRGLDYVVQQKSLANYQIQGHDAVCNVDISDPSEAGEIWLQGQPIVPTSSAACTLKGIAQYTSQGKKLDVAYVMAHDLPLKLFADKAFYSGGLNADKKRTITAFLLKDDAEKFALAHAGKLMDYTQAVSFISDGGHP